MEADRPSSEETEPAGSEDQGSPRTKARSYECMFCKRGFSNAQALGGHMNIHRKDRAKLKQPTNHSQFPFEIPAKFVPSYPPALTSYARQLMPSGNDRGFVFTPPWMVETPSRGDGPTQLPLFVETPSRGDDRASISRRWRHEEFGGRSGYGPAVEELDLELRLGPERSDGSMALREFL